MTLLWWQHIPVSLSPIAFTIMGMPVSWYALFFLLGSGLVYWFVQKEALQKDIFTKEEYQDFSFGVFLSAVVGGKLGFLLLYWWPFVSLENSFIPHAGGLGLPGMSFMGGLLGVTLYIYYFARKKKKNFFVLTDLIAVWVPIALFCGRLGSFLHGELIGRVTKYPWGMYFSESAVLRHPSMLYAAFLEGIVLFILLFFLKKKQEAGRITAWFCILYGILRFLSELFREPDSQIGYFGIFTVNQLFALLLVVVGLILFTVKKVKNTVY